MTKKTLSILASISLIAAVGMFIVGSNSGHLTELKDFFWIPLILAVGFYMAGQKKA